MLFVQILMKTSATSDLPRWSPAFIHCD